MLKSFPNSKRYILRSTQKRGALLLEILVATAILGIILSIGSQMVFVSLQSNKMAGDRDVAVGILNETIEAVRAIGDGRWQTIFELAHNGTHYYPVALNGTWAVSAGGSDESILVNGINFMRYFIIENVSRCNDGSRGVASSTTCSPGNNYSDDPSTQKVVVSVGWNGGEPIVQTEYVIRWRNKVCPQTNWSAGKSFPADPAPSSPCNTSPNSYFSDDGNIDNTSMPGSIKLQ